MPKSQFLRTVSAQRSGRSEKDCRYTLQRRNIQISERAGEFNSNIDDFTDVELDIFRHQVEKQLERERRLHNARSHLYSLSRHIQLYTALKMLIS